MSELTDLNMIQLEQAVRQAALPAEQQIAKLKHWDVAYEIGSDFENWCRWALDGMDAPDLTDEQRSRLIALDKWLDEMTNRHDGLGTVDAVRSRPEWEEVRRQARGILEAFGWSIEEVDRRKDEQIMFREALCVAALAAEQQIACFPPGSPVPSWIAGDFFNWYGLLRRRTDFTPTDGQRSAIDALDARLNEMSESHDRDEELWTVKGLQCRPEWEEVRRQARGILEMFGWSIDE